MHQIDFEFLTTSLYFIMRNFSISNSVHFSSKHAFSFANQALTSARDFYFFLSGKISRAFNALTS